MAKLHGTRADFISDGSSSDSDSLPEIGSLRERLARKRKLLSTVTNTSSEFKNKLQNVTKSCLSSANIQHSDEQNEDTVVNLVKEKRQNVEYSNSAFSYTNTETVTTYKCSESKSTVVLSDTESVELTAGESDSCISVEQGFVSASSVTSDCSSIRSTSALNNAEKKERKKRTTEEIESNKQKAKEKKEERERIKMAKEAEKQMRKVERESKKQVSLGSCLKYLTVLVDTGVMNTCGCGAVLFKACEELGVACQTRELRVPSTIMWERQVTECSMSADMRVETINSAAEEKEVLSMIPATDFVLMVNTYKQKQRGLYEDGVTLRDYVLKQQAVLQDHSITVVVPGLEQYFRDLKSQNKRKHKEAVLSTNPNYVAGKAGKGRAPTVKVSRVDVEEAVTDAQLQTGCCTLMVETPEEVADLVRRFSKAVAERPAKKDRFDPVFSFHEEGVGGVKVDKNGHGLLKVWKQQLMQFKNVSQDIAQAIITQYPSPRLLKQAYLRCSNEKEIIGVLENIVVRRGAGVLETTRRIGKEQSRRIYTFFSSEDPDLVIK